jgi:hypothetical protein
MEQQDLSHERSSCTIVEHVTYPDGRVASPLGEAHPFVPFDHRLVGVVVESRVIGRADVRNPGLPILPADVDPVRRFRQRGVDRGGERIDPVRPYGPVQVTGPSLVSYLVGCSSPSRRSVDASAITFTAAPMAPLSFRHRRQ